MEYKIFYDDRMFVISDNEEQCFNAVNGLGARANNSGIAKLISLFEASPIMKELWLYSEQPHASFEQFSEFFTTIIAAGGLVHNSNDDLLLIYRNQHWDLPKGKVEKGETVKDAALREVGEECGLSDLHVVKHLTVTYHVYPLNNKRVLKETHWYEMYYSGKEPLVPQTEEQIEKAEWVSKSKLAEHFDSMYVSIKEVFAMSGVQS